MSTAGGGGRSSFDNYRAPTDLYSSHHQQSAPYMVGNNSNNSSQRGSYVMGPDMSSSASSRGYNNGGNNLSSGGGRQSNRTGPYSMAQQHHGGSRSSGNTSAAAGSVEANPNLYVHNVPKDSNEEELRSLFGRYGTVERVRLKVNQKVGPHAVYAFVTFSSTSEAQIALNNLQGTDIRGRALRIEFQRTTNGPSSNNHNSSTSSGSGGGAGYNNENSPSNNYGGNPTGSERFGDGSAVGGSPSTCAFTGPASAKSPGQHSTASSPPYGASSASFYSRSGLNSQQPPQTPPAQSPAFPDSSNPSAYPFQPSPQPLNPPQLAVQGGGDVAGLASFNSWPTQQQQQPQSSDPPIQPAGWGAPAISNNSNNPNPRGAQAMYQLMEGTQRGGVSGGQQGSHARDLSGEYMPPTKRGRFQSPSMRPEDSRDVGSLLSALHQVVVDTKPEALNLVQSLSEILLSSQPQSATGGFPGTPTASVGGFTPSKWPTYQLTRPQRHMAQAGALRLDAETNRWQVNLAPLLEPLKPNLFPRQAPEQQHLAPQPVMSPPEAQVGPQAVVQPGTWGQPPSQRPMLAQHTDAMSSAAAVISPMPASAEQLVPVTASAAEIAKPVPSQNVAESREASIAQWKARLASLPVAPEGAAGSTTGSAAAVSWTGVLARNEKKKTPVAIRRLAGNVEQYLPPMGNCLNISHRSALDEVWKKELGAVGILSGTESAKAFNEYITYFQEKNRAGVVRLERNEYQLVYLVPSTIPGVTEMFGSLLDGLPPDCLLAVVARNPGADASAVAAPAVPSTEGTTSALVLPPSTLDQPAMGSGASAGGDRHGQQSPGNLAALSAASPPTGLGGL